ncbi:hypothetical protein [Actinoplanes auranticolor]|uniref:Uncharacterized protein n=1 Tax=Actinoplanes auranticolor TaxID=47988 RepID=A0A919VQB2_9ACTN|nr:hypothetical protein [Actinoplanes auranticolor]GIM65241.1 hypothetical protein Aau02nite_15680 [Actinoplanes auranticolor]
MMWTGRADEAGALGLLLDRTYAEVAAAAARPRSLDREFLIGQFDLWDNHLLPAVAAGTAPPWTRRSAARAVWRRLGLAAGDEHRRWMAGHLDGLGHDPAALLGPERSSRPSRSGDGRLIPVPQPLTAEAAELICADYELTGGTLAGARIDVHGSDPQQISGSLKLAPGCRRHPADSPVPPALHFHVGELTSGVFPHAERGSVRLGGELTVVPAPDEVGLDVPAGGTALRLAGRDLRWYPDDVDWSGSAAARASDEGVREDAPELPELAARGADVLGILQLTIMWQLRRMRYAGLLRRWELAAAGALCGGLNAQLFRMTPTALRSRWAAHRVRSLLETEDSQARDLLRIVGRHLPLEVPELPGAAAPPVPSRITVGTAARLPAELDFTGGRLRFVDTAAGRAGPGETVIHLDARRGDRDTIVVIVLSEPLGCAPLTVTPDGLALTGAPTLDVTADDVTMALPLPGGDWTIRAAAGSWYVD